MYRRPVSPYNSRVQTYLEALERDQTINTLRRQYAHHRSIEVQYDDLKYQILKTEKQNKKLEQKNIEIQQQYLAKIKQNKSLIAQLSNSIAVAEQKLKDCTKSQTENQESNQTCIQEIKKLKNQICECQEQNKLMEADIAKQDGLVYQFQKSLQEIVGKKKEKQAENRKDSEAVDGEFGEYRQLQERVKCQEIINLQLKEQLSLLRAKKGKLQTKVEQVQQKMKQLRKKLQHSEYQSEKLTKRCHQSQKQSTKLYSQSLTLKQNIEQSLTKNKDHTNKLKTLEQILKQNINSLHTKSTTKEKLINQLGEIVKDIEKVETVIKVVDRQTQEQECNNKGLVQNLKKSIQSDEEAVKALTRKAAILNLISQS